MTFSTYFMTVILAITSVAVFGQVTLRPAWLDGPHARSTEGFLPPEYGGQFASRVEFEIKDQTRVVRGAFADLRGIAHSGILALRDLTAVPRTVKGWNTGMDRVYSLQLIGKRSDTPARFVCTGWDDDLGVSRALEIVVDSNGLTSQMQIGSDSSAGEIWSAATILGDRMFVYDVQSHSILKVNDSNADGRPDLLDPSFAVSVPQGWGDDLANAALPIRGFKGLSSGEIVIITETYVRGNVSIVPSGSGYVLHHNPPPPASPSVDLYDRLVKNQTRVLVYGKSGTEFRVYRENSTGPRRTRFETLDGAGGGPRHRGIDGTAVGDLEDQARSDRSKRSNWRLVVDQGHE